jgi:hypothetical protein
MLSFKANGWARQPGCSSGLWVPACAGTTVNAGGRIFDIRFTKTSL